MDEIGLGSWISRRRAIAPDRIAVVHEGHTRTYAELDERVRRLSGALREQGVAAGDRVAYLGPNHPAFLELLFAANAIGAIPVPVNHRLDPDDVGYVLADAGPRLVVHTRDLGDLAGASGAPTVTLEGEYEAWLGSGAPTLATPADLDAPALITYTSGTTGRPKGVVLSHRNLTYNVMNFLVVGDFRAHDVSLAIAPFFRVGGLAVTLLETLVVGGTVVVMGTFAPAPALTLIERHGVTVIFGGPELLGALESDRTFPTTDFSSVRVCYTGGAPVPETMLHRFLERDIPILQGYGLSEAGPLALMLGPDDMIRKVGSAGRPIFFTETRVVGPGSRDVAPGETGEVIVRGPNVMRGYWNDPEATRAAITEDGWLRTGDAGRVDDEGFVYIAGRMRDAFTHDDVVVLPWDVEAVLLEHPDVSDAAVVGVADDAHGHVARAFAVLGGDAAPDAVVAWASARLPRPDVLGSLEVVDEIPRNPSGKILRARLVS